MSETLSKNEKAVLSHILQDPIISNVELAKELNLTSVGVAKIRKRLESKGIVKGCNLNVNMRSLGLNTFAMIHIRLTEEGWGYDNGIGIADGFAAYPNIINVFRIAESDVSHILFCVFRNIDEMTRYLRVLQSRFSNYFEVRRTFIFPVDTILKQNIVPLVLKTIEELGRERMPEPMQVKTNKH